MDGLGRAYGLGRRKRSVARVWVSLSEGDGGVFFVNKRPMIDYFPRDHHQNEVLSIFCLFLFCHSLVIIGKSPYLEGITAPVQSVHAWCVGAVSRIGIWLPALSHPVDSQPITVVCDSCRYLCTAELVSSPELGDSTPCLTKDCTPSDSDLHYRVHIPNHSPSTRPG